MIRNSGNSFTTRIEWKRSIKVGLMSNNSNSGSKFDYYENNSNDFRREELNEYTFSPIKLIINDTWPAIETLLSTNTPGP